MLSQFWLAKKNSATSRWQCELIKVVTLLGSLRLNRRSLWPHIHIHNIANYHSIYFICLLIKRDHSCTSTYTVPVAANSIQCGDRVKKWQRELSNSCFISIVLQNGSETNKLTNRMIKQLLNSVITKYVSLSVSQINSTSQLYIL